MWALYKIPLMWLSIWRGPGGGVYESSPCFSSIPGPAGRVAPQPGQGRMAMGFQHALHGMKRFPDTSGSTGQGGHATPRTRHR